MIKITTIHVTFANPERSLAPEQVHQRKSPEIDEGYEYEEQEEE